MFELLLVRHAIAFEPDRKHWPDDDERPLTPEGVDKFRQAAGALRELTEAPQAMWASPLVRAYQTAKVLTETAGWPQAEEFERLSPRGTSSAVLEFLNKQSAARIALVGHEPNLSLLAAACLTGSDGAASIEMKKGAILCLSFPRRAHAGEATLLWLAPPRLLRAAR